MILGHAHPAVVDAVQRVAADGLSFGAPTPSETELAAEIIGRVAPVERLRMVNSGTEATMSAIRLARGYTGRAKIVKFSGCYHGHSDALLADAGSGVATLGLPSSPGVTGQPRPTRSCCRTTTFAAVEEIFARFGDEIACVITEASPGNMGTVPPLPGYNAALRRITADHGALLISDEVMTGFRVSRSGWYGVDPVDADLFTFGKVMSGGLPAAAFGGRAEVMERLAPLGPVYQAGTLSGNPVAMAAGLATLRAADDAAYATLDANADRLAATARPGVDRSRCGAPGSACGQHAQRVLLRRAGDRLRLGEGDRDLALPGVLPRPARRRVSTRRPARSRPGSCQPLWMTTRSTASPPPCPARRAPQRKPTRAGMTEKTIVHVMRHGEVHNPEKILYGRLPDYHLSERGRAQAQAVADWLADRDIVYVVASPLERAQETAAPIAARSACRSTPTTT